MARWEPVDEKDRFSAWLRSEFAASNAIIDALMEYLRLTGGPGEFDEVMSRVQQRRSAWPPVLHLQQYFSIGEVTSALHQLQWRKHRVQMETVIAENKVIENGGNSNSNGHEKQQDLKRGDELEGLSLHENFIEETSISKLVSFLYEMRDKGENGELQGRTMVVSKRPNRGHAREIIQFGLPITDGRLNEEIKFDASNCKMVEPIPSLIENVLDRIIEMQILKEKPDYCVVDYIREDDFFNPHKWPSWYGRPVCSLFLTECAVIFGSLSLSLSPGTLLLMNDKSLDKTKRSIPSQPKKRVILTFGKSQPLINANTFSSSYKIEPCVPSYNQVPPLYGNYSSCTMHPAMPLFVEIPAAMHFPGNGFPTFGTGVFLPPNGSS